MTHPTATPGIIRTVALAVLVAASLGLAACNRQSGTTPATGNGGSSSGATGSSGSSTSPSGAAGDTSTGGTPGGSGGSSSGAAGAGGTGGSTGSTTPGSSTTTPPASAPR